MQFLPLPDSIQTRTEPNLNSIPYHLMQVQILQPQHPVSAAPRGFSESAVASVQPVSQLGSAAVYSGWSVAGEHWQAHLTDEKTEAQRGYVTHWGHTGSWETIVIINPDHTSGHGTQVSQTLKAPAMITSQGWEAGWCLLWRISNFNMPTGLLEDLIKIQVLIQ